MNEYINLTLENIDEEHISVEVYSGKVLENRNIGRYSD